MAEYLIQDTTLTAIADAVRTKTETTGSILVSDMASKINSIQTGSDVLNFEVVGGTTQPSNPKENTIWVDTDAEITSWVFSATEPTEPTEGMVWIFIGTSSTVEFNALKNNDIQVYPISAKQYISGAWVDKTAESYQSGAWAEWIEHLYNSGAIVEELAFVKKAISGNSGTNQTPTITYNADNFVIQNEAARHDGGIVYFPTMVDLSKYKTIEAVMSMECATNKAGALCVYSSLSGGYSTDNVVASVNVDNDTSMRTRTIDVSSLNGNYYIGFLIYGQSLRISCQRISLIP